MRWSELGCLFAAEVMVATGEGSGGASKCRVKWQGVEFSL